MYSTRIHQLIREIEIKLVELMAFKLSGLKETLRSHAYNHDNDGFKVA